MLSARPWEGMGEGRGHGEGLAKEDGGCKGEMTKNTEKNAVFVIVAPCLG
jgi:hypothetical protein